jgi:hypothetical protein
MSDDLLPSSGWSKPKQQPARRKQQSLCLFLASFLFDFLFNPEDGDSVFLRNISILEE